ncbi:MAG: hypothetical protein ABL974_00175 [Prosthecobacter sp.]
MLEKWLYVVEQWLPCGHDAGIVFPETVGHQRGLEIHVGAANDVRNAPDTEHGDQRFANMHETALSVFDEKDSAGDMIPQCTHTPTPCHQMEEIALKSKAGLPDRRI